jgi:hypothetical protein
MIGSGDSSIDFSPGDLVYYDKCGGPYQTVFPFAEEEARGIGVIISEIKTYEHQGENVRWTSILDEKGLKQDFAIDYLEPVTI